MGAKREAKKARNGTWASLTFKIIGVGAGGREAMCQQPCGKKLQLRMRTLAVWVQIPMLSALKSYDPPMGWSSNLPVPEFLIMVTITGLSELMEPRCMQLSRPRAQSSENTSFEYWLTHRVSPRPTLLIQSRPQQIVTHWPAS